MIRDPLYRQILKGLESQLDPVLFERCASDLLRDEWPTLVPIRGGTDSGMDGAIGDAKGPPFPLISTTAEDVIGNLKKNLKSYKKNRGKRRRVLFATSRKVSPQRIKNLHKAANALGFTLIQVYTQDAIADRLYGNPQWCLELLNLTGDPPALSALPATRRPYISQPLIGRTDDIEWVKKTPNDLLIFGAPGSGKTFLFRAIRSELEALFVISHDMCKIANAIRTAKPKVLMIDDAHSQPDFLRQLRQFRNDIMAKYRIIANCWSGQREMVGDALQITSSSTRELRLLTRDEMVQIINGSGIKGPTGLIRELVDQADGRPGLAVTLVHLWLRGDIERVAFGEALSSDVRLTFEPIIGSQAIKVLSAFAVGGESGMPLKAVSEFLGLPEIQIIDIVTLLAAGGIVNEVDRTTLCVQPEPLRHALVRDTFFKGAFSLDSRELIGLAPNLDDVTLTLIGARRRGAKVPDSLLKSLVEQSPRRVIWARYAGLGPSESEWVLQNHLDRLSSVIRPALFHIPEKVIPLLLRAAIDDERELHSYPEHPLRQIQDWVRSAPPGRGQAVLRRKTLLETALAWHSSSQNVKVTIKAIQLSLSPDFEMTEQDPGAGNTISFRWGYLDLDELKQLSGLWAKALSFLSSTHIEDWGALQTLIDDWVHLHRPVKNLPRPFLKVKREIAIQMLKDIVTLANGQLGILQWVKRITTSCRIKLPIALDSEYETLYPIENLSDIDKFQRRSALKAKALAQKWAKESPQKIVPQIITFEKEALKSGRTWPRMSPYVCREIADLTDNPIEWLNALVEAPAPRDLIFVFLELLKAINPPGFEIVLTTCLKESDLKGVTATIVLSMSTLSDNLLRLALTNLEGMANLIEMSCMRREIPEQHLPLLLCHDDAAIAAAAAVGEWRSSTPQNVRESLCEVWRPAVVKYVRDAHDLVSMFKAVPGLPMEWLRARIVETNVRLYREEKSLSVAVKELTVEERKQLLRELDESKVLAEAIVNLLVDDNAELYGYLLSLEHLKSHHLVPLKGYPDVAIWQEKAVVALNKGYSPEEVAHAVHGNSWEWSGAESNMWNNWAKRFTNLENHSHYDLRQVGRIGRSNAEELRDRAAQREFKTAIHGRREGYS